MDDGDHPWGMATSSTQQAALIGETIFLGQDQDQEFKLIKTYYETETEK